MSSSFSITAQDALKMLIEGNRRFVSGKPIHPRQGKARREEIASESSPFAVILTCSDARVSPEILFDQGLGDLFVVRNEGNIIDDIVIGSIEYAVEYLGCPLVLVLGHQKCGAVIAATRGGEDHSHINSILSKLAPAVLKARDMDGDLVANAIDANIIEVVNELRHSEPVLAKFLYEGRVKIGGARYEPGRGSVVLL